MLRAEAIRAIRRHGPDAVEAARAAIRRIDLIALSDALLETAALLDPITVRTLDAIHLASALSVGDDLDAFVTYDSRMTAAARALGVTAVSPR